MPFPYIFLSGSEALEYTQLPEKQYFRNDLADQELSQELYAKAGQIWNSFGCSKFSDFLRVYNLVDCVTLFDLLAYFREIIFNKFGLEMTCFLSLPQLSFTCMLKISRVQIQLFDKSLETAFELVRRSIYGGIVSCNKRYLEATETRVIEFVDFNALYATIQSTYPMPYSSYEFIPTDEHDWSQMACDGVFGFFLEVDIEFPDSTHINLDCLIPICEHKLVPGAKTKRLISDFHKKFNYVLSLQHFQLLLSLGVQITKIHQVLRFKQSFYMKEYVDIVAEWRSQARDAFSINLYKSLVNVIWGRCCEKLEFRKCVEIVTSEKRLE